MFNWLAEPPPDHLFEVSEYALAGVSPRSPERQNRERFTERGLTPSPSQPNVTRPQLYRDAAPKIAAANGTRRINTALVIPDYAVRMAILDFEEFPAKEEDRLALLRFRLRKSVPFHIDDARVSYSTQESTSNQLEVLAVAVSNPILHEYETLFTQAGFRVGLVVPSLIAALRFCDPLHEGITLLAKRAGASLSMGLIERGQLRLVRCLDLTGEDSAEESSPASVFPVLQQTLAFAEDQLSQKVNRALLCGFGMDTAGIGEQLENEFGIPYAPVTSRFGAAHAENAGILGLLEQYT